MSISNPATSNELQIAVDPATQTASKPGVRRLLTICLAGLVSMLACAIVVVASSRGLSRAEAAVAQAKSDAEEARKNAATRIDALEKDNAVLKKQIELAKADFVKQAEKLASAEKEALRTRGDLDAAVKQVAELSKKYADAVDAEHKAMLEEAAAKKETATKAAKAPAVVEEVHEVNNNVNKNGKRRGSVAMLPRTTPSFSELDKNMDGRMSLAEFTAGFPGLDNAEEKFKELDENNDGYLSLDEYKAGFPDPPTVHVQRKKKKS
jgi:hypothetical protein